MTLRTIQPTTPDPNVLQHLDSSYRRYETILKKKATWKPAERAKVLLALIAFSPLSTNGQREAKVDFHMSGVRAGSFTLYVTLPEKWEYKGGYGRDGLMDETARADWDLARSAEIVDALIEAGYTDARIADIGMDRVTMGYGKRNVRTFRIRVGAVPVFAIDDPQDKQIVDHAYALYSRIRQIATAEMKFRIDHMRPHNYQTIIGLAAEYVARREEIEITLTDGAINRMVIGIDSALNADVERNAFLNNQGRIHINAPNSAMHPDLQVWRVEINYKVDRGYGFNGQGSRPAKYVGEFDDPRDAARIVIAAREAKDEMASDADYIRLLETAFRMADKIAIDATE